MLIPRYSLRTTIIAFTCFAMFFLIVGYAYRGDAWAVVITVAILSILATLAIQALFYAVVAVFGKIIGAQIAPARTSQGGIQSSSNEPTPATRKEQTPSVTP